MQFRRLSVGETERVWDSKVDGTVTDRTKSFEFVITTAENALFSLFVNSVETSLQVNVYTRNAPGEEVLALSFPLLTAPTPELLLEKTTAITSSVRIEIIAVGEVDFTLYVTGLSAGELETKITPNSEFGSTNITVPSNTVTTLIPAATTTQSGLVIRNWGLPGENVLLTRFGGTTTDSVLFVNSTIAGANATDGYPIHPGEALQLEVGAGVTVYGFAVLARDVRLLSAGT